uniref:Protein kinase domain-containing protein n=1 Tax=Oryza brachyantha TaxID=4533 RepID=J3MIV1_ORYBR
MAAAVDDEGLELLPVFVGVVAGLRRYRVGLDPHNVAWPVGLNFYMFPICSSTNQAERRKYTIRAEDYELYEEIGQGVGALVYRSLCRPLNEIVAVKVLDFERTNSATW